MEISIYIVRILRSAPLMPAESESRRLDKIGAVYDRIGKAIDLTPIVYSRFP